MGNQESQESHKCEWGRARSVVLTGTDLSNASEASRLHRVLVAALDRRVETLDWNHFLLRLLDPEDRTFTGPDLLCVMLVRFEDWDHFHEYALNRSPRPSYEVVEKKVNEIIYGLECASTRCNGRCLICILPCSPLVGRVPELVSFSQGMIALLKNALSPHDFVRILELDSGVAVAKDDAEFRRATAELQAEIEAYCGMPSFPKEHQ
jgi:hypothetical protein